MAVRFVFALIAAAIVELPVYHLSSSPSTMVRLATPLRRHWERGPLLLRLWRLYCQPERHRAIERQDYALESLSIFCAPCKQRPPGSPLDCRFGW